jgi:hypothetical protein
VKYKVIFVNWTKPFFYKNKGKEYDVVDYELLINKVAIISARKFLKVPIKLYTDDVGYSFYEKHNMIELFDEIDVDTLNKHNEHTLDAGKWWTSGKSIAIGKEESPFLFLDNDFIVRSELPKTIFDYDLVHTHWELHRGKYFVTDELIKKYKVPIKNFNQRMLMPNTSFVFMNNKELQNSYYCNHLNVVLTEYKDIPEWLWLLSDQSILGYCARELNSKVGCIEDKTYLGFSEEALFSDVSQKDCGYSPMWVDSNSSNIIGNFKYWHIWLEKHHMHKNLKYRKNAISKLNNILNQNKNKVLL